MLKYFIISFIYKLMEIRSPEYNIHRLIEPAPPYLSPQNLLGVYSPTVTPSVTSRLFLVHLTLTGRVRNCS